MLLDPGIHASAAAPPQALPCGPPSCWYVHRQTDRVCCGPVFTSGLLPLLVHPLAGCWCGAPPRQHCLKQQAPSLSVMRWAVLLPCLVAPAAPSWLGRGGVEGAGQEQCLLHHRWGARMSVTHSLKPAAYCCILNGNPQSSSFEPP